MATVKLDPRVSPSEAYKDFSHLRVPRNSSKGVAPSGPPAPPSHLWGPVRTGTGLTQRKANKWPKGSVSAGTEVEQTERDSDLHLTD